MFNKIPYKILITLSLFTIWLLFFTNFIFTTQKENPDLADNWSIGHAICALAKSNKFFQ